MSSTGGDAGDGRAQVSRHQIDTACPALPAGSFRPFHCQFDRAGLLIIPVSAMRVCAASCSGVSAW